MNFDKLQTVVARQRETSRLLCINMAADPGSSGGKTTDSSQLDDKLDIYSEKFDPLAFLQSDQVKVPRPNAKVFDNIAMWHTHYKRGSQDAPKRGKKPEKAALPTRRWLPHQCKCKFWYFLVCNRVYRAPVRACTVCR